MPVYEYCCAQCRSEFELMRPMSEVNLPATCPACGGKGVKLVSNYASQVDSYLRPPTKPAFRGRPMAAQ